MLFSIKSSTASISFLRELKNRVAKTLSQFFVKKKFHVVFLLPTTTHTDIQEFTTLREHEPQNMLADSETNTLSSTTSVTKRTVKLKGGDVMSCCRIMTYSLDSVVTFDHDRMTII